MARGRAKARMRAKERALANKNIEINHIEPTLGQNVFEETESESESVSTITPQNEYKVEDWEVTFAMWFGGEDQTTQTVEDESIDIHSAKKRAYVCDI